MARILVTGGLGFIGSHVTEQLLSMGHELWVIDSGDNFTNLSKDSFSAVQRQRLKSCEGARGVESLRLQSDYHPSSALLDFAPDYILHLAATPVASLVQSDPRQGFINIVSSTLGLLSCEKLMRGLRRFVYVSSSMVYGDFIYGEPTEDHPTRPKNLYGSFKLMAEDLTRSMCKNLAVEHVIVRPSAVYGPLDFNGRVVQQFIESVRDGRRLKVNGANEVLDFTFVKDLCDGLVKVLFNERAAGETFNLTRGQGRSLGELVHMLQFHYPKLDFSIEKRDSERPKRGALSIAHARQVLGYDPKISLEEGLELYLRSFLNHQL